MYEINPYSGHSFFGFFAVLFHRIFLFFKGDLEHIASDEVQLLVLTLIALSSALIGTFLVLKKMTMLANSLSHTIPVLKKRWMIYLQNLNLNK